MKRYFPVIDGEINLGKIDLILEKPNLRLFGSDEKYKTIYEKAACILEGFCRGHAFPDGNKRTALLATFAFLQANDYYLVIPLDAVSFLVYVAQNKGNTEEDIDKLIHEIAVWIEDRTAQNKKELEVINKKYLKGPVRKLVLISLTGVGLFYAYHKINKWFATKYHPEYKQNLSQIIKFLNDTLADSEKAIKNAS